MSSITIDVRLINNSGIGTYIKNLVPLVINHFHYLDFNLLIDVRLNEYYEQFYGMSHVTLIQCMSDLYTLVEQYEILNAIPQNTQLFWSPHYVIPCLYSGKILSTIHDTCHLALRDSFSGFHKQLYANLMFKIVSRKSAHIITVSEFSKQEIIRFTSTKSDDITVTHNGVSDEFLNFSSQQKCQYDFPYIIFIGNIKPNKNLLRLLVAFEKLLDKIPHNLLIVGKKDGFIEADPAVFEYSTRMRERVMFTGFVNDLTLKQILNNAAALVFPSLYEGFGLPPLEAMAIGCPVVVSHTASMPEICGDAALYFDPYDPDDIASQIYRIVTDTALAQSLVQIGKNRLEFFRWETSAMQTCEVIDNLLSTKR
jgi:glycosyltransferase involved in cell wall biosynthesis